MYTFEYEGDEAEVWDEAIAWMFLFVHISLSCIKSCPRGAIGALGLSGVSQPQWY